MSPSSRLSPAARHLPAPSNPAYTYDASWHLVYGAGYGHGHHTRIKPEMKVHLVYESVGYALELADVGSPAAMDRISDIIKAVLPRQDRDPISSCYGVWPWYGEEGVREMSEADHNWAEFMTTSLMELDHLVGDRLDTTLRQAMRQAMLDGAISIMRRNVTPGYTNIAVMGSVAAVAVGEQQNRPELVAFGKALLGEVDRMVTAAGGFSEYNSPTYNTVVLVELDRATMLTRDRTYLAHVDSLRQRMWRLVAEQYHAPTSQWAGAKSRSYHDRLCGWPLGLLRMRTGIDIPQHLNAKVPDWDTWALRPGIPIPAEFRHYFTDARPDRVVVQHVGNPKSPEVLTTWHTPTVTLGTVDRSSTLYQRRPLCGYWIAQGEPAALLQLRLLKGEPERAGTMEGEDLGFGRVHLAQNRNRVLVAASFLNDHGDHQGYLDRRADGRYPGRNVRLQLSLDGKGATVKQMGATHFELVCGNTRAVVNGLADPSLNGRSGIWRCGGEGNKVWVEAVVELPDGILDVNAAQDLRLAMAVEVISGGDATSPAVPMDSLKDNDWRNVQWGDLSVVVPRKSGKWY